MPTPNLLHPVDVEIEQISKATTFYDEDAREPVQTAARAAKKTVQGQVKWTAETDSRPTKVGDEEGSSGYVLFRYVDLAAQTIILVEGDRITKVGTVETDIYISRLRPTGHYTDVNGPTLLKAYFVDKQPSRGAG